MNDNGDIIRKMQSIAVQLGTRVHGIAFLTDIEAPIQTINAYLDSYNKHLFEAVAAQTGADVKEIADKEKRTPEQERFMIEIAARVAHVRIQRYLSSDYLIAYNIIEKRYAGDRQTTNDEVSDLCIILQYFFALHPDYDPLDNGNIGEDEETELIALIDKITAQMNNNTRIPLLEAICAAIGVDKAVFTGTQTKLERLSCIVPTKHVIPNNKLSNTLTDDIIDAGGFDLVVCGKGKKAVTAICVLTYEGDNVKLTGRQSFTEYDRNVYNAVTSLFIYGDETHIMTPAMVYRAMVNMTDTESPSAQQIGAVTRSLDKMRFIRARIDCTDELKRYGACIEGEQITSGQIDTYLLTADAITVDAGGKAVKAYRIIKTPILYEYSSLTHQVLTVPASLLDIKADGQRVKNTETRIAVKGYLLRRIKGMQGDNKLDNDCISLESYEKNGEHHPGLYEVAGEENATRAVKQRIRDYAEDVLRYWISEKFIAGYILIRESGSARAVKSIKISL